MGFIKYTMADGKSYTIPETALKEIERNEKKLRISRAESIEMWLCDNDIIINEEQEELDKKAKKYKRENGESLKVRKSTPKTITYTDAEVELFEVLKKGFADIPFTESKTNKQIEVRYKDIDFSIKIVKHRPPKEK